MTVPDTPPHPVTLGLGLGLDSFGEVTSDAGGRLLSDPVTIRGIVKEGARADEVGLDHFAVGEHHIEAMPVSSPDVVLAAIAARTPRIRLESGVTVLGSDDPVRVYQRYATLDAVSGGRAELILGRGSSTESFPLYGFDLADYERLFEEKLELFAELRNEGPVTWTGNTRPPLRGARLFPRTDAGLPTWVGVGGSPESAVRAARQRMHLMLAIIGGEPGRFAPLSELFRYANRRLGHAGAHIGVHSPGHVAATDAQAAAEYWPLYRDFLPTARRARGIPDPNPASFEREIGPDGSLYVGAPESVAEKIVNTMRTLQADRFDLKYGIHGMPVAQLLESIELFGREVAPLVRAPTGVRGYHAGGRDGQVDRMTGQEPLTSPANCIHSQRGQAHGDGRLDLRAADRARRRKPISTPAASCPRAVVSRQAVRPPERRSRRRGFTGLRTWPDLRSGLGHEPLSSECTLRTELERSQLRAPSSTPWIEASSNSGSRGRDMKINVNYQACNGHGECVIEAPEVFDLADDSDVVVVLEEAPAEARRAQVERAVAMCPVAALQIVG